MVDEHEIINFAAAASKHRKIWNHNNDYGVSGMQKDPKQIKEEKEKERKEKAKAETERQLNEAEELQEKLNTKLSHDDRRQIVMNLGAIAVSLFGGEIEAKRKMPEVFRAAFGSRYESYYKKRGRLLRFPSEREPGDRPGETYAHGRPYLDIAEALAKFNPQKELIDDKAFNRMILRMIQGTCFDSTAIAKGRLGAKGEAAYRGILRDLMMKLEPKLAQMLEAGLETGKSIEDFSIDPDGIDEYDCLKKELPEIEIGRVYNDIPVIHAWPTGFTVQDVWDRMIGIVLSSEQLKHLALRWDLAPHFGERTLADQSAINHTVFNELYELFHACKFPIFLELIEESKGIDFVGLSTKDALEKLIDNIGRDEINALIKISNSRYKIDHFDPVLKGLTNHELVGLMYQESSGKPVEEGDAATRQKILKLLYDALLLDREEIDPGHDERTEKDQPKKEMTQPELDAFIEFIKEYVKESEYLFLSSLRNSPAFMSASRSVQIVPALNKATGEWCLGIHLEVMGGTTDLQPGSRVSGLVAEAFSSLTSDAKSKTSFDQSMNAKIGLIFAILVGNGELESFKLAGYDRKLIVGWTVDAETEEVMITIAENLMDYSGVYGDMLDNVLGLSPSWVSVLQSPQMVSAALAPGKMENDSYHIKLDLDLSDGEAYPFLPADSFARALVADLHVDSDEGSPSVILSKLTEAIESKTANLAGQAAEKLGQVEDGLRYLRD